MPPRLVPVAIPSRRRLSCPPARAKSGDRRACQAGARPRAGAAHVKELVAQNHAKYCALGLEADIFAAGLQRKESHGKVVFGSVQSVARNLDQFRSEFSLLIVDECHRISDDDDSQYQQIIGHLRQVNPQIRLLGLTATPFRLGKGWIYQFHYHGMVRGDEKAPCSATASMSYRCAI